MSAVELWSIILMWIITVVLAFLYGYGAGYQDGVADKNMGMDAHN